MMFSHQVKYDLNLSMRFTTARIELKGYASLLDGDTGNLKGLA
jgi:hypothetical protein